MKYPINYKEITNKSEYYLELVRAHEEALAYLMGFAWCKAVINSHVYLNLGSTISIFIFEIVNSASSDDSYLWIIVGDIPPMYLDTHGPKTTKEALKEYVRLAEDWIGSVKYGRSTEGCYPFNAEPNLEMTTLLEKRTAFMKNTLINNIEDISSPA